MKFIRFTTKVTKANTNTKTLRTSIPKQIVQLLDLKERDYIEWLISFENGKVSVCISKKRDTEEMQNAN